MEDIRYMISEASKRVEVEDHVLRYWEDQLELPIGRNEMGHRYYKDSDIELLKAIKELKDQGFQLKAIKMLLPNLHKLDSLDTQTISKLKDDLNCKVIELWGEDNHPVTEDGTSIISSDGEKKEEPNDKMGNFRAIMNHIIMSALKENNMLLSEEIALNVTDGVVKEMNFLMRLQEEKEEERYRKFDATLRDYQRSRSVAAATLEGRLKKKSKFLKKNKVHI
ncbi:MAG TPA: MerR family transcriptional regulator [Mobilitalea sp.]|nr:MerR family transcriptional regulator [Mobilitalea sp.]